MKRAILFDLDGTLIDSLSDIANSLNHVLANRGLPTHTRDAYRYLVGEGASELIRGALAPELRVSLHDEVLREYRARYKTHLVVDSRPYEGIVDVLQALDARGLARGVVTNKPHAAAVEIVGRLFPQFPFGAVVGQRDDVPRKPAADMPLDAARKLGVAPDECLFVGDTHVDIEAARAAGMISVGCEWGFRGREELESANADHIIAHPHELLPLLD